jgi:hypothetical protein
MGSATSRFRRWRRFLPQLTEHVVDCAHLELVTTRSAEIATLLRAALTSAAGPSNPPRVANFCKPARSSTDSSSSATAQSFTITDMGMP